MCPHNPEYTELDCAYSCSHFNDGTKTPEQVIDQFCSVMQAAYKRNKLEVPVLEDFAYGDQAQQSIDIWGSPSDRMLIFLHGGYWQEGDRKWITSCVPQFVARGISVACIGYKYASAEHPLSQVIEDVNLAVKVLMEKYTDCKKFVLSGHSAGAHLAYKAFSSVSDPRICGLALLSPVLFLEPLVDTYIGRGIGLSLDEARRCSCALEEISSKKGLNIKIINAEFEAPSLTKQAEDFTEKILGDGHSVTHQIVPGVDHFTLIEQLINDSPQVQAMLSLFES